MRHTYRVTDHRTWIDRSSATMTRHCTETTVTRSDGRVYGLYFDHVTHCIVGLGPSRIVLRYPGRVALDWDGPTAKAVRAAVEDWRVECISPQKAG